MANDVESEESYRKIIEALDRDGDGMVKRIHFQKAIYGSGLKRQDPRLMEMWEAFDEEADDDDNEDNPDSSVDKMVEIARLGGPIVPKALSCQLIVPSFPEFCGVMKNLYDEIKKETSLKGNVAKYIPQLAKVPASHFGVAITTVDGQQFHIGDAKTPFCLQSVSKPLSYLLALREHGEEQVHVHVGREPSGQKFNSMTLKEKAEPDKDGVKRSVPHNPMINAGAIISCSLIQNQANVADRLDYYMHEVSRMTINPVSFDPAVFLSERSSADRNQALTYMMKETNAFPEEAGVEETLELYFQTCSLTTDAVNLSCIGATLANGGTNPYTGDEIFSSRSTRDCLSLMLSCGMYDYSGEWAFKIGLPAKSGVSGAVLIVVPNVMGICVFSPPLDENGNSVRGIEFAKKVVQTFTLHHYDSVRGLSDNTKIDPTKRTGLDFESQVVALLFAASAGCVQDVERLIALGADVSFCDYDSRQAIHLAAAEGSLEVVECLVERGADINAKDRWGHTPLSEARENNKQDIVQYLLSKGAVE